MLNAADYGIDLSGLSDTVADMQSAFTAIAGKMLSIPAGATVRCDSALTIPAGTLIYAYGATLDFSNAGHITCLSFASGGGIYGARIIGAGNASYNANGIGIACTGTYNHPGAPTFVNAPTIVDCSVEEMGNFGVRLQYTNGGFVHRNKISGSGYAAIGGMSCNDLSIEANDINDVSPGASGDAYGIFVDRQELGTETSNPRSFRVSIKGNTVRNVASGSGNNGQAIDTHGGVDFVIEGNRVYFCEVGIAVTGSSVGGAQALGPKRVTVANNVIEGNRVGYGILVSGAITGGSTVQGYAEDVVLTGNVINGHGIAGDALTGAVFCQGTKNLNITGGAIKHAACYGINLGIANLGFNITGVSIIDVFDNTAVVAGGLLIGGNDCRGRASELTMRYEDSSLGTYVMVTAVRVGGSLSGLDLDIGPLLLSGIDASHLSLSLATTSGVNAAGVMKQTGAATLASGVKDVVMPRRMPTSAISVFIQGAVNETFRVTAKSATQFTIVSSNAASTATVDWQATT